MWQKLINYVKLSRLELKHVNWPTRRQLGAFTVTVILASVGVAALLGGADVVFSNLLKLAF